MGFKPKLGFARNGAQLEVRGDIQGEMQDINLAVGRILAMFGHVQRRQKRTRLRAPCLVRLGFRPGGQDGTGEEEGDEADSFLPTGRDGSAVACGQG